MKFDFVPNGVCARKITFNVENGRLYGVNFVGG